MVVKTASRVSQARLLLKPALRTIRWLNLAVMVPIGFLIVYAGHHHGGDPSVASLPASGVLLAVWIGFLLDDAAAESVTSAPTRLIVRRTVRIAVGIPGIAIAWTLFVMYANGAEKATTLSMALAAAALVALGFAALGTRVGGNGRGGPTAAAGLFLVFLVLPLVFKVSLTLDPRTDSWHHLYGRWLWIGAAGLVTFLFASADPARRGPISWMRGGWRHPVPVVTEAAS